MRCRILSELSAIHPFDVVEAQHLADARAWVESGAPLCRVAKPASPPKHLVSYFAVVDGENILLVDHKNAQLWLPPGGHVEPGENPRQTVARELEEELGLCIQERAIGPPRMVTVTQTVGLTAGHTDVSLWYVVPGDRAAHLEFDATEFNAVQWFPFTAAPLNRSDPHLARFIAKLRVTEA